MRLFNALLLVVMLSGCAGYPHPITSNESTVVMQHEYSKTVYAQIEADKACEVYGKRAQLVNMSCTDPIEPNTIDNPYEVITIRKCTSHYECN